MNLLLFSFGAALGAPIRFWIDNKFRSRFQFPIGVMIVNLAGAFLIGLYASHMNYFVVGFCGALTTWSTYIVDVFMGIEKRAYKSSIINLFGSLILGVLAFKFGHSLS
jgi:CrcB protein